MLLQRVVTVIVLAPLVLGALFSPWPILFKLIVIAALVAAFREFFALAKFSPLEGRIGLLLGIVHASFLLFVPYNGEGLLLETALLALATLAIFLFHHGDLTTLGSRLGWTFLGLFYLGSLGALIGLLRDFPSGSFWVLLLFAMTWLNDTVAYFTGHWWGKRRLAATVSPGKTLEGLWGGFGGSLIGYLLVWFGLGRETLPLLPGLLMVPLSGLFGPLGDLSESLLKRIAGVKDSGHIIPGHGGMMDRIDALLFNAPIVYAFALWHS